jgi:hypothetical protein
LLMPTHFETLIQNGSHTFEDKVMWLYEQVVTEPAIANVKL